MAYDIFWSKERDKAVSQRGELDEEIQELERHRLMWGDDKTCMFTDAYPSEPFDLLFVGGIMGVIYADYRR